MQVSVNRIQAAFELMFKSFLDKAFAKSLGLQKRTEKELLPLVRVGLLCFFREGVVPEVTVETPWTKSGSSRIDFKIGNTAVEFAVRNPGRSKGNVSAKSNQSEIRKLMKWKDGKSVLILFDFSRDPLPEDGFSEFRKHPSLGKGNHNKNAYTLLYFHIEKLRPVQVSCHRKEIRRISKA